MPKITIPCIGLYFWYLFILNEFQQGFLYLIAGEEKMIAQNWDSKCLLTQDYKNAKTIEAA